MHVVLDVDSLYAFIQGGPREQKTTRTLAVMNVNAAPHYARQGPLTLFSIMHSTGENARKNGYSTSAFALKMLQRH